LKISYTNEKTCYVLNIKRSIEDSIHKREYMLRVKHKEIDRNLHTLIEIYATSYT